MRLLRSFALLLILGLTWTSAAQAQQLINCATATPCTTSGPSMTGTGDDAWLGGGKINANFLQLYSYVASELYLAPSGDTSGVTDRANLIADINTLASGIYLPTGGSSYLPAVKIVFGPGQFYFTTGGINLFGTDILKVSGLWLQGQGNGLTQINYSPTVATAPLFINQRGLNVHVTDMGFTEGGTAADFLWSQEQAGLSNVQNFTWENVSWGSTPGSAWGQLFRVTGGNNNSEWRFLNDAVSGAVANWVYVPPRVTTSISATSTITITGSGNNAEQVEVGDTGAFTTTPPAPLNSNPLTTQYYVVAVSGNTFQISTSFNGTPVTFTGSGTPTFQTGSDQFLNFWFDHPRFWVNLTNSSWLTLNYGGSVKISKADVSNYGPPSPTCLFNLLNSVHAGGVMSFEVDGIRVEYTSDNACMMHSQWWRGSISWNNRDESSQAGLRNIANVYDTYELITSGGPTIEFRNSELMGTHNYINNTGNYAYQRDVLYQGVTLYDNPTFANFIVMTNNGNTGGYPIIHCRECRNNLVASTVGYTEIVDTDLNWQYANHGAVTTHRAPCLGTNSDWPTGGGSFEVRLPLNAAIVDTWFWKGTSGSGGNFQYTLQTTEATPTLIAGGAATPMAGTGATAAIPLYVTYGADNATLTTPFQMTTDLARTIQLSDTLAGGRSGTFTNVHCFIDYIGKNFAPAMNDDGWLSLAS
jgi:hypothetical protein